MNTSSIGRRFFLAVPFCALLFWGCASAPEQPSGPPAAADSPAPAEKPAPAAKAAPEQPPGETPPEVEETDPFLRILNRMAALLGAGDYDGALVLFDDVDRLDAETGAPDAKKAEHSLLKASVLYSAGRLTESKDIAQAVLDQAGNAETELASDARYLLAAIAAAEGKGKDQEARLLQILKDDPANVGALTGLGNIYLSKRGQSDLKKAGGYFDQALKADPKDADALIGRAMVCRYNHERDKAEQYLNRAVAAHPERADVWHERARLYREWNHPQDALNDLDQAKARDPNSYFIAADRGNALMDLGRKAEALDEYQRAISINPNVFMAYVYSAGLKYDTGDFAGAARDFEMQIRLNPDYYFAYEGLGMARMHLSEWAGARDAFREAWNKTPDEWYYALLASICWIKATGNPSAPRQFLSQVLRKVPREAKGGARNPPYYLLRLFHDNTGDNDIVVMVDKEKNPDMKARMLFYLAWFYNLKDNQKLANRYYLAARDLDRKGIPEWKLNEWILAERGLDDDK